MTTDPGELGELGRAVKQAQWRQHRAIERRLAGVGTTLAQWDALRAVAQRAGSSAHELALATFQSDQSFGTLASRVVAAGLVVRSSGAGRRTEHRLTPSGEAMLHQAQQAVDETLADSYSDLDADERATLLALLGRLGP